MLAIGAVAAGPALAAGTTVTVRVEGKTRTLLAPRLVTTHAGSITRGGAPSGKCPATSANGALDVATRHHWSGTWSSTFDEYFITTILGDTESGTHAFWEIFVNNVAASAGACDIKLHRGEQLLFAAVPASGTVHPLALSAPKAATSGQPFTVKAVYYTAKGKAKSLAGVKIAGGGLSATTGSDGTATLTATHSGAVTLQASKKGYVRSAPERVTVS